MGTFFNKKPTQMELQPSPTGKLALTLPPVPFLYSLVNGPIPLYDAKDPNGQPIGDVVEARHGSDGPGSLPAIDAWPFVQPDLPTIAKALTGK